MSTLHVEGRLLSEEPLLRSQQMALLFTELHPIFQAAFLNTLGTMTKSWDVMAWRDVDRHLTVDGKRLVNDLLYDHPVKRDPSVRYPEDVG